MARQQGDDKLKGNYIVIDTEKEEIQFCFNGYIVQRKELKKFYDYQEKQKQEYRDYLLSKKKPKTVFRFGRHYAERYKYTPYDILAYYVNYHPVAVGCITLLTFIAFLLLIFN